MGCAWFPLAAADGVAHGDAGTRTRTRDQDTEGGCWGWTQRGVCRCSWEASGPPEAVSGDRLVAPSWQAEPPGGHRTPNVGSAVECGTSSDDVNTAFVLMPR
ncbi:unnamed protein product [Prorocentrum cordatum]|uniref:Subtilisin n=1 Tax=Prorocentrum cordatum TaxID=2364126 RepID=A0ABN9TQN1_9DINO|nr:unnamed protein product [Polarella glacialis]